MESGGTDCESLPGNPLSDDQDTGATIPLMINCARSNNYEAAKELRKNHGDAVERNSKELVPVPKVNMEMGDLGRNPLHKAAEDSNIEITRLLLKNPEMKVDAQDEFGYTALHRATHQAKPDKEMISLLINHGADIGVKNEFGDTPLHLATDQTNPDKEIIRLLIMHGADIGVKNNTGEIPRLSTADYQELFNGCISVVKAGKNFLVSGFKYVCW